jgi:DNA polymerase
MDDSSQPDSQELARQARHHLESLKAAGVDWLPAAHTAKRPHRSRSDAAEAPSLPLFDQPAGAELPLEQRRHQLALLAEKVAACPRCPELVATRKQTVFADGHPGVELCLIGEAPGADEDEQGLPFVGAAGQLLNRILAACNLQREDVYICNVIKCRPPRNRTPMPNEIANCREYLERQLELVQPKFICTLGTSAAQGLLGTTQSLGKLRGRFHDYRGIPVLCTYHPAYLLPHRNPAKKKDVWEDMKVLMARMGRPVK